jgi:hypothetical protein
MSIIIFIFKFLFIWQRKFTALLIIFTAGFSVWKDNIFLFWILYFLLIFTIYFKYLIKFFN